MRKIFVCAMLILAHPAPGAALTPADTLVGVPRVGMTNRIPGGTVVRNGKAYYTAPGQGANPITCRGPIDSYVWELYGARVEWHHCWREKEKEPYDPDAVQPR